jgi:hypothetical protein
MTNGEIYSNAVNLVNGFNSDNEIYFPAAVNFSIQKNKNLFTSIAEEIEKGRMNIIQHYSNGSEGENFTIDPADIDKANKELNDLLSISQDVKIYTSNIEDINDIKLTSTQMQAIMFMIDEEDNLN